MSHSPDGYGDENSRDPGNMVVGVITDACIKCKHMACVEVCPVDAFYEGKNMLVINPLECVSCGCCIEECPVGAIVFEDNPVAKPWVELNAKYSRLWPNVTFDGGQTPPDADRFHPMPGKFERYFSPDPGNGDIGSPIEPTRNRSCARCNRESLFVRVIERLKKLLI